MVRKPAIEPRRTRFAVLLAQHLADGTRPNGRGEPWTFAAFADQIQSSRVNDFVSARSVSNWCKGRSLPVAVEPILRAIFGADRSASADAREALREAFKFARRAKQIEHAPPDPAGVVWVAEGDQVVMDRSVRPSDKRAASDPLRQQLQAAIRGHACRLAERAKRLENSRAWGGMAIAASEFGGIVAGDVLTRLGEAYALLLQLGRYLETDARVQRHTACADDPLDADLHGLLTDLVRTAAPWLRGFPTVATWDDEAGKVLSRASDLVESARDFTRIARDKEAISARDAREIELLGDIAHDEDFQGHKAGGRAVGDVRNLLLALAAVYAAALAGSDLAVRSILVRRAWAVFASATTPMEALAVDMPDDLRHSFQALAQEAAGEANTEALTVIPDDVEDQARAMILAGHPPPAEWRPHIRKLVFPPNGSWGDVAPLAGLIALQWLDLNGTQVRDVGPLAGLTALQRLFLQNTQVTDIAPLAGLSALQRLDLNGTQVSEVVSLAGLKELQLVDLRSTRVKPDDVPRGWKARGIAVLYDSPVIERSRAPARRSSRR